MNEVIRAIKERRSVRAYTDRQLSPEALNLILEAGRFAPTAHNGQPWHFTVVQNMSLMDEVNSKAKAVMATFEDEWLSNMGRNPEAHLTYHAPTVIFVSAKEGAMGFQTDTSAAVQNMMLAAESLGIGSVWVGLLWFFMGLPEASSMLRIPDGYKLAHAAAFGYAKGPKLQAPARDPDVVTYIR